MVHSLHLGNGRRPLPHIHFPLEICPVHEFFSINSDNPASELHPILPPTNPRMIRRLIKTMVFSVSLLEAVHAPPE